MSAVSFDLYAAAEQEMERDGFSPHFPPGTDEQVAALQGSHPQPSESARDMRSAPWSSIDNDTSRDLDQIEYAEQTAEGIKVYVGIADVDASVARDSPLDRHANSETTTVYTAIRIFPMLPEQLSTDLTSLNEGEDRNALVVAFIVSQDGSISAPEIFRAIVQNKAQLAYNSVGPWLEGHLPAPPKIAASEEIAAQIRLQDKAACLLRDKRHRLGALNFDRVETQAVIDQGQVKDISARIKTRADQLIEDFMVAANETMAQTLKARGVSSIRRVVKSPERWARIVDLAKRHNAVLPAAPDSGALNTFLQERKSADPIHFPDLSLSVMKLMGPGQYVLSRPGDSEQGHFGLAAHDYTHSTAPNRRFADLVTQRLIKATLTDEKPPYTDAELDAIAHNCTVQRRLREESGTRNGQEDGGRCVSGKDWADVSRRGDGEQSERRLRSRFESARRR